MAAPVALIESHRGGTLESLNAGAVAVTDVRGKVIASAGDPGWLTFTRSTLKALQALSFLQSGGASRLGFIEQDLALMCASHSGEPFHLEGVRRVFAAAGLVESALRTPPGYPLDDGAREAVIRAGGGPAPVLMNCSGKHAAMLSTCVANGWPTDTYLDADGVLRLAVADHHQGDRCRRRRPRQYFVDRCRCEPLKHHGHVEYDNPRHCVPGDQCRVVRDRGSRDGRHPHHR